MLTLGLLTILGITQSNGGIQNCGVASECTIEADASTIVIVDKSVDKVIIECKTENSCKYANENEPGLKIYSSANETFLTCPEESSCEGVEVNLGITPPITLGNYLSSNFESIRYLVEILCEGKQACKSMVINQKGKLLGQLTVRTPDSNSINSETASFLDGVINCDTSKCVIECGTAQDSCTNVKCFAENNAECDCNGDNCPDGLSSPDTSSPTPSPVPTRATTAEPTPSPISRTKLNCKESIDCVPYDDYDVTCPDTITNCDIKCIEENQCQNGVVIEVNSLNANIQCDGKNACDKVNINVNVASKVTITCSDEKVCSNAIINVLNKNANINVIINGKEGFFYGKLFCNGECNLNCNGEKACYNTIYECTNTFDKCTPIEFNNIKNFGDSSCKLNDDNCNPKVDGDTRIIAPKDVKKLTIDCNDEKECKKKHDGLVIYSAATDVNVLCGKDGCEEMEMYIGELYGEYIPKGFEEKNFGPKEICTTNNFGVESCVSQKMIVNIECPKDGSCKGIKLVAMGNIDVSINGAGISSLQNGDIVCDECNKIDMKCREVNGCTDAVLSESSIGLINCVNIDGDDDDDIVTEATCPNVGILRKSISGVNNNNSNNGGIVNENKTKFILILGIGLMSIFGCFIFGWLKKNGGNDKKYNSIKGDGSKSMVKNENIYATYQIELH